MTVYDIQTEAPQLRGLSAGRSKIKHHPNKIKRFHLIVAIGGETFATCNERVGAVVPLENMQAEVSGWKNLVWVCS